MKQYSSFYVEPFLSGGLSIPFIMTRHHSEVGSGKVLFGPFVSYVPMNMSAESGVSMHGYNIGVCWRYAFM